MSNSISGYIVLRKPEFNFDESGRGAYLPYAPKIGDQLYGGIDRMQWFDLDEGYYEKSLPMELIKIRERIYSANQQSSDMKLIDSLDDAERVLTYSNKSICRNELIGVVEEKHFDHSNLNNVKNKRSILGCDVFCDGYGSLIREGVFSKPEYFGEHIDKLNESGIFHCDESSIEKYIEFYQMKSREGQVESMEGKIKAIQILRISL
ncbi:MAG: hypothetical protein KUG81_01630 [Gammaproteobacteria bacterium]|nr:hypothetical protein [Gammaproteobacteria bacterium]